MTQPMPAGCRFMGGEDWNDPFLLVALTHGCDAVDDGNFPGYTVPSDVAGPDDDSDSVETSPATLMFTANENKPVGIGDYPLRQCFASGQWGAPHAMTCVDGTWYLIEFAPDPISAKPFPPTGERLG